MEIKCPQCGSRAMSLLRTDDVIENVCVSCGLVTITSVPQRPMNRDAETMRIVRTPPH
jgi:hypothetical protein